MASGPRNNGAPVGAPALVLAHRLPWPPQSGADLRNWQNVEALAGAGGVTVFALSRETERPPCAGLIDWRVASDRPLDAPRARAEDTLRWLRDPLGHPSDGWFSEVASAELLELVARVEPDVVVVECLWLHRYIAPLKALGCRVVLDAHNLEGPLHEELASERDDPFSAAFASRAGLIEAAALESVDQIWVCSEDDVHRIAERYPSAAPVAVVPNTIDVDRYSRGSGPRSQSTLVYPGAFEYLPNAMAARRLVEDVFPALAAVRPEARLSLVGSSPTDWMEEAAARDPRIEVTGIVPDTLPFLHDASAMPIPLHEGGGTRFKALEAFAAELPVVSTEKGVEGLGLVPGEHYLPAETPEEFVDALLALFDDEGLRAGLTARALGKVRDDYSHAAARESVYAALGLKKKSFT